MKKKGKTFERNLSGSSDPFSLQNSVIYFSTAAKSHEAPFYHQANQKRNRKKKKRKEKKTLDVTVELFDKEDIIPFHPQGSPILP